MELIPTIEAEFNNEENLLNENLPETEKIAIDGPVASGKGTVARLLAENLGFLNVDSGAMYRSVTLLAIENGIGFEDEDGIVAAIQSTSLEQRLPTEEEKLDDRKLTILLGNKDVTPKIRTPEVDKVVATVSKHPKVRAALLSKQQLLAKGQNVIMEGRDITHTVLPDAQIRIFLDASPEVRAKRRHAEYLQKGKTETFEEILADLNKRDELDRKKNLRLEPGVFYLDCSELKTDQVVSIIMEMLLQNRQLRLLQAESNDYSQ